MVYTKPINVIDPDEYVGHGKSFDIVFSDKIELVAKTDVLSKTKALSVSTSFKNGVLSVSVALHELLHIKTLRYLIAHILGVHVDSIVFQYKSGKWIDPSSLPLTSSDRYEELTFIGNRDIRVKIKKIMKPRQNNYENMFMKELSTMLQFQIKPIPTYSTTEFVFVAYDKHCTNVDLPRMFNSIDKYPKAFIHSASLNEYLGENPNVAFLKHYDASWSPSKGFNVCKNSVSFFINIPIPTVLVEALRLYQITILANGLILISFRYIGLIQDHAQISHIITEWLENNLVSYLERARLDEFIYDFDFNYDFDIYEMCHSMNINLKTTDKFDLLSVINTLPGVQSAYTTKSSFRSMFHQCYGPESQFMLEYLANLSPRFQASMITMFYCAQVNVNQRTDGINVQIVNSASYRTTEILIGLLMGIIETKPFPSSDNIFAQLRDVDPKIRIRQLKELDPVAFDNRLQGDKLSDYSQLVQSNEQRPSVITMKQFGQLQHKYPDSIIDLENQTTHARMYLACPFSEYPIINFHAQGDELCIIKCTTKFSNNVQYQYCNRQYNGIENDKVANPVFSSNTIIRFTPILDPGRKCLLPEEIFNAFPRSVLLKLEDELDLKPYGLTDYIDLIREETEYHINTIMVPGVEYGVVLSIYSPSFDSSQRFLLCSMSTGEPERFTTKTDNVFIQQIMHLSHVQETIDRFKSFMKKVLPNIKIGSDINSLIKSLPDPVVVNDTICGLMIDGVYWRTPLVPLFNLSVNGQTFSLKSLPDVSMINAEGQVIDDGQVCAVVVDGVYIPVKPTKPLDGVPIVHVDPYWALNEPLLTTKSSEDDEMKPESVQSININRLKLIYIHVCQEIYGEITEESLMKMKERFGGTTKIKDDGLLSWRHSIIPKRSFDIPITDVDIASFMYEYASEYWQPKERQTISMVRKIMFG